MPGRNPSPRLALLGAASTLITLAVDSGEAPPTEFRLFVAGWNNTENGNYLFDAEAASAVMATYGAHKVDRMIDLEHLSLDTESVSFDPDARGWCKLELREDGSLWAVNVTWTPDGAARLADKRQRYISPTFGVDSKTKRVTKILNIALTALPATHGTPELVAARVDAETPAAIDKITKLSAGASMDSKLVSEALEALMAGDEAKCTEILKSLVVAAAGGEAAPAADDAPAEPGPEELAAEPAPTALAADPAAEEDKNEVAAATSRLTRITGKTTLGGAVDEVEVWRKSHIEIEARTAKLAVETAALELGKRKENAIALTALGAETPVTTGLGAKTPKLCARLLNEPLEEQTARVAVLLAARGGKLPAITPPAGNDANGLSDKELAMCTRMKLDPAVYAKTRNAIKARSNGTGV